jgi:hypothetical protein
MTKEPEKLEVGDLVDAQFYVILLEGVITEISDGSERGYPGELMYRVAIPPEKQGTWLHRWEIIRKIDPTEAIDEMKRFQKQRARFLVNAKAMKILLEQPVKPFKGVL